MGLPCGTQSHSDVTVSVSVPAVLFQIQLPANLPGEGRAQGLRLLPFMKESWLEFLAHLFSLAYLCLLQPFWGMNR